MLRRRATCPQPACPPEQDERAAALLLGLWAAAARYGIARDQSGCTLTYRAPPWTSPALTVASERLDQSTTLDDGSSPRKSCQLGVAVESRYFGVESVVPWAEPGVCAVATQSFTEERYGPLGLGLMRGGHSAEEALRALVAGDDGEPLRQSMVDATGAIPVQDEMGLR